MSSTNAFEMKWDLQNKEYFIKKPVTFIQWFYEYAPTLPYYTRVRFKWILMVSLNNISCFVKYKYFVCVSRWHHKLFAYFKTVNIWRTRQVIEKIKTLCRSILIRCSIEIKTRQRNFHDTAPLNWTLKHTATQCTERIIDEFNVLRRTKWVTCMLKGMIALNIV